MIEEDHIVAMRPIIETCTPRPDVLQGGLTDAHFAAQLDQVVSSPGQYPVYGDPTEFFAVTFPTKGLRDLLTSTFARLSGEGGKADGGEHGVVRFQTSFGGGKTHGLIAAYHLAKGARPIGIESFVDPSLLPDDCAVAAAVGDTIDATTGSTVQGQRVLTMWGSIGVQLDAWAELHEHDETRSAPGKDVWKEIFSRKPTLVIIDEVAAHIRSLSSSDSEALRRQADAMTSFLFNLFSAAAEVPTARVIITLATETDAFAKETARVSEVLDPTSDKASEVDSVVERYREVLVPAQDNEIAEILRRRLFAEIDAKAATDTGKTFAKAYADLEKRDIALDFHGDVAKTIAASYPFHPDLIRVLDSRVGTIPEFQRTRGALRLLAETIAALWEGETDAVIINAADLPLDASPVAYSLTQAIGREAFTPVIGADIAGTDSHAAVVDKTRFAGARPFATRAAATVFLHSLQLTANVGASLSDVWRGSLVPGDDPDILEEALRQLDTAAWHLDYDGTRYRFQTEPNPRKVVEDEKVAIQPSAVREELERRIGLIFANAGPIKTRIFPSSPADLDDRPELRLAVMHWDDYEVTSRSASPPPTTLVDILDTFGVGEANRTFRNAIVFLVADSDNIDAMKETVRYDQAANRIVNDPERMQSFAPEVQRKLKTIADKAKLDARVAITRCYRHLYYPKADKANKNLRHHELPAQAQGEQERSQTPVIQEVLESLGKIRSTPIASDYLATNVGFPRTDPVSTNDTLESFWRNHDAALVINPNLITDAITAGVRNGTWIYYDAEAERAYDESSPPPAPRISPNAYLYGRAKAEEAGVLRREPTWPDVKSIIDRAGGELGGAELRARLEETLGYEPTKGSITAILARASQQAANPIVVIQGEPTTDAKSLSPSNIERTPIEKVTVLTADRAKAHGIEHESKPPAGLIEKDEGSPGQVFGTLTDRVSSRGADRTIDHVEISMSVVGSGIDGVRTLLAAAPMMARVPFSVTVDGEATFDGVAGGVSVAGIGGDEKTARSLVKELLDLLGKAADLTLTVTLTHAPSEPFGIDSDTWRSISSTITELKPGSIAVEVRGS